MFKLVRNTIKIKFSYNGRGIAFDGEGLWSFSNDLAIDVVMFGVDILHHLILIIEKIPF